MKLLLTSGGVCNPSIREALVDLLGRPIEECHALAIPTAEYGHPMCGPANAGRFITGTMPVPMADLGWASVGVLELTALPTVGRERWVPWIEEADVLLASGGAADYLAHWMRETGLADLLPTWPDKVWVGLSAGSMVMTPRIGPEFVAWRRPDGSDRTLGVVDFSIFPHLDVFPTNTLAKAGEWAARIDGPAYVLDDQSAIVVDGDRVEVVSEGEWHHFPAG